MRLLPFGAALLQTRSPAPAERLEDHQDWVLAEVAPVGKSGVGVGVAGVLFRLGRFRRALGKGFATQLGDFCVSDEVDDLCF